jgi:hypothetical protein
MKLLRVRRIKPEDAKPGELYVVTARTLFDKAYDAAPGVLEFYDTFTEEVTPVEIIEQ